MQSNWRCWWPSHAPSVLTFRRRKHHQQKGNSRVRATRGYVQMHPPMAQCEVGVAVGWHLLLLGELARVRRGLRREPPSVHRVGFTGSVSPGRFHRVGFTGSLSPGRFHRVAFTGVGFTGSVSPGRFHRVGFTGSVSPGRFHRVGFIGSLLGESLWRRAEGMDR
eukprot:scaffold85937_cov60-Phaeocystis_antarctica.AAC.5